MSDTAPKTVKQAAADAIAQVNTKIYAPAFVHEFNALAKQAGLTEITSDDQFAQAMSVVGAIRAEKVAAEKRAAAASPLAKAAAALGHRAAAPEATAVSGDALAKVAALDSELIGALIDLEIATAAEKQAAHMVAAGHHAAAGHAAAAGHVAAAGHAAAGHPAAAGHQAAAGHAAAAGHVAAAGHAAAAPEHKPAAEPAKA